MCFLIVDYMIWYDPIMIWSLTWKWCHNVLRTTNRRSEWVTNCRNCSSCYSHLKMPSFGPSIKIVVILSSDDGYYDNIVHCTVRVYRVCTCTYGWEQPRLQTITIPIYITGRETSRKVQYDYVTQPCQVSVRMPDSSGPDLWRRERLSHVLPIMKAVVRPARWL